MSQTISCQLLEVENAFYIQELQGDHCRQILAGMNGLLLGVVSNGMFCHSSRFVGMFVFRIRLWVTRLRTNSLEAAI